MKPIIFHQIYLASWCHFKIGIYFFKNHMAHLVVFTCEITMTLQRSVDHRWGTSVVVHFEALTENLTWLRGLGRC